MDGRAGTRGAARRSTVLLAGLLAMACGSGESDGTGAPERDGAAEGPSSAEPVAGPAAAPERVLGAGPHTGLFVRLAGGPAFTPCGTDQVLPLVDDATATEVTRRIRLERPAEEGPVLVTLRLAGRGATDATDSLRVTELVALHPAASCPEAPAQRPLEGTAWQLSGLPEPDAAVRAAGAWLRLREDVGFIEGSTGCRPLAGRYDWTVTRLRFSGLERAAGACQAAALHAAFLDALARVESYRIHGDTLRLLAEEGAVATFRAPEA